MRFSRYYISLFVLLMGLASSGISAQENTDGSRIINLNEVQNDGKREEVQRYFGYENLLFRYLSLPYDIGMNVNQQGKYVDVGFALFITLPILLLSFLFRRKILFYISILALLLYWVTNHSYSYVWNEEYGPVWNNQEGWTDYVRDHPKAVVESFLVSVFGVSNTLSLPVRKLADSISGNQDAVTYPILFASLLLSLFLIVRTKSLSPTIKILTLIFVSYSFLWLVLSGGIIWYGFLLFPIGYGLLSYYFERKKKSKELHIKVYRYSFMFILGVWIFVAYVSRISNINIIQPGKESDMGKSIVDANLFNYSAGVISAKQSRERSYKFINTALDRVNSTDGLVYQVGTSMTFEIRDNPNRVVPDNTLNQFFIVLDRYRDKQMVVDVFKASGVQFFVVDLYTHTLDRTPERSLEKKFQLFLNTLINNPKVRLLATDRIIEITDSSGQAQRVANVFGEKIVEFGSYAIYELI